VPGKKAEKGYVLLRETLAETGKIGVARVVIRTREYLAAVIPQQHALILMLLRYPQELVDAEDYTIPSKSAAEYRVTRKELEMARALIESMSGKWTPGDYRDEFRARLHKVIEKRLKQKGVVAAPEPDDARTREDAATNVVDFMALLKQSIDTKRRTPAKKAVPVKKTAKKTAPKRAAKKTAAKAPSPKRRKSA